MWWDDISIKTRFLNRALYSVNTSSWLQIPSAYPAYFDSNFGHLITSRFSPHYHLLHLIYRFEWVTPSTPNVRHSWLLVHAIFICEALPTAVTNIQRSETLRISMNRSRRLRQDITMTLDRRSNWYYEQVGHIFQAPSTYLKQSPIVFIRTHESKT